MKALIIFGYLNQPRKHSFSFARVLYHVNTSAELYRQRFLNELLIEMPKKPQKEDTLRHVKYREKLGGKLPVPGVIDVQVIGSGGWGTPKSVMVATSHVSYLFNCGEGTQRIAGEHKMKIARLENIFITHKSWENIGGLLGMCLTLETSHVSKMTVHGPPGVEKVLGMVKGFAESNTISVDKRELQEGFYEDFALRVEYVPIQRKTSQDATDSTPVLTEQTEISDLPGGSHLANTDTDAVPAKRRRLSEKSDTVVVYVCKPHQNIRKVEPKKLFELGLKPTPLIGKLVAGESVTLEDGRVIQPEQILNDEEVPRPFIFVECPHEDYLDALVLAPQLHKYQQSASGDPTDSVDVVIHMTPCDVMEDPRYKQFMERFGGETNHLILNETTSPVANLGIYKLQAQLNLLHPSVFPLLPHQVEPPSVPARTNDRETMGYSTLRYRCRPSKGFDREQHVALDTNAYVQEALRMPKAEETLSQLKDKLKELSAEITEREFPEVLFLGTGSSVPSKGRNVSGILMNIDCDTSILLDCGEGTTGQIIRHYGNKAEEMFRRIKAVFVSHMHADHHLGIFSILHERRKALLAVDQPVTPMLVLAPIQMSRWLDFYDQEMEAIQNQIRSIPLQKILPHQLGSSLIDYGYLLQLLGLHQFLPVEVDHCQNSFGVSIYHSSGWKIVYSGDTMPCERLVDAGRGCDLLIHEATMEDQLEEEAKFKTHSTTSQAIEVGLKMEAKFILLNHFSQRYSKLPVFNDKFSDKVGISFDNMRVRLSDLPLLPHLTKPLKVIYSEDYAVMKERMVKRNLKKERAEKQQQQRQQDAEQLTLPLDVQKFF